MRQQINLYQPVFSAERKLFSARMSAAAFGLVAVGLIAFSVHANLRVLKLSRDVEVLRAQQAEQEASLASAGELQASDLKSEDVETRIKRLDAAVTARSRALQVLQSGAAGRTTGFAPRMEALARRHVEGLWIDSMVLSGTNGSMSLSGSTLNPGVVPVYLRSLASEPLLSGTRFDDFVIERPAQRPAIAPDEGRTNTDDGVVNTEKVASKHIRFRAGSKALSATTPETPT